MPTDKEDYVSTTVLARSLQMKNTDLFALLDDNGWTVKDGKNKVLTEKGIRAGGQYKSNDRGERWVVWDPSIIETQLFKQEILGNMDQKKRKFKLPGVEDLNKDQDRVLRLPENGQFLIVGGPGTGKSVVALLRAMKCHEKNDYKFLTYNKVLLSSTKQLVDFKLESLTLDSFLGKLYYYVFNRYLPNIMNDHVGKDDFLPIDYAQVKSELEQIEYTSRSTHIIIDEGQDKPPEYFDLLMSFGLENFFIVADQNQQITETNSSRQQLTNIMGLEKKQVIELNENYRNSYPIALFSSTFYTDPASPPPKLPPESRSSLGVPMLIQYNNLQEAIHVILREYDRDDRNLIGVIVANDTLRNFYATHLENSEIRRDNPKPIISSYSSGDARQPNINFAYSGIVVLNDKSIKGLEFDIVFIIVDGFNINNNDLNSMKKRFYVMSSRAIKKLVLLKNNDYRGGIDAILTTDEKILKRERLNHG